MKEYWKNLKFKTDIVFGYIFFILAFLSDDKTIAGTNLIIAIILLATREIKIQVNDKIDRDSK